MRDGAGEGQGRCLSNVIDLGIWLLPVPQAVQSCHELLLWLIPAV